MRRSSWTGSFFFLVAAIWAAAVAAQDSDTLFQDHRENYEFELSQLLADMRTDLGVEVLCPTTLSDRKIAVAPWMLADNAEVRLATLLTPVGLYFEKTGEKSYKVVEPCYYRRSLCEARAHLDRLSARCSTREQWEARRAELKAAILETLGLNPMPNRCAPNPLWSNLREYDGYSVENLAVAVLPHFYVSCSVFRPTENADGPRPLILCPHGHSTDLNDESHHGRFTPNMQYRCATLARMGATVCSYSMFAYETSQLQVEADGHRESGFSGTMQTLSTIRLIDFFSERPEIDAKRIGITGESGGGTQTFLAAALDERITVTAPIVMVSAIFYGGCPCESGSPIHLQCGGTCNAEIAAMAAPRPMLVVSITKDWTKNVPELEFPYLQKIYALYDAVSNVENAHFDEEHDYGKTKRDAVYPFMAARLGLDLSMVDESKVTIEPASALKPFGPDGALKPADALEGLDTLKKVFSENKPK